MIYCEICHEEYQEGHLERHRETCVVRLVFRCSICSEDYMSREGLWNHLNLHEISEESKDLHYQELKAKQKLLQCASCNDQRGYSESSYLIHCHNFHENREAHNQIVAADDSFLEPVPIKAEHLNSDDEQPRQSKKEQDTKTSKRRYNRLIESSPADTNKNNRRSLFRCDKCGNVLFYKSSLVRHAKKCSALDKIARKTPVSASDAHKQAVVSISDSKSKVGSATDKSDNDVSMDGEVNGKSTNSHALQQTRHPDAKKCPNCSRRFRKLGTHLAWCGGAQHACDLCGRKFSLVSRLERHKIYIHNVGGPSQNANTEGVSYAEGENSIETMHTTQEITTCIICGMSVDANHLIEHKLICSQHSENADNGLPFSEIKVEETVVQDRDYQVAKNNGPDKTLVKLLKLDGNQSKVVKVEAATNLANVVQVKEEILENEDTIDTEHQETTESLESRFECLTCGLSFGNVHALNYHKIVTHTKAKFKCSLCQKMFFFAWYLYRHKKGCSRLWCHKCNIRFRSACELKKHNTEKHDGESKGGENETTFEYPIRKRRQYEPPVRNEAGNLVWPCSICTMNFRKRGSQRFHVISYHTEPKHRCSFCRKTFHVGAELRRHEKSCSKMQCHECDIKFSSQARLNRHFKDKHPHSTETKNLEAVDADALEKVVEIEGKCSENVNATVKTQRLQKVLDCEQSKLVKIEASTNLESGVQLEADKLENEKNMDTEHQETMQAQASESRFDCLDCEKSFKNVHALNYHKIVAHTKEKFKCSLCQQMFHFAWGLHRHKRGCSTLRCHKCNIKFNTSRELDKHNTEKHTGKSKDDENETTIEYRSEYPRRKPRQYEPPIRNEAGNLVWPCSICKMTFQKKAAQRFHVISYHTEPQHKCPLCRKTFHIASELRRHEKSCSNKRCHECCIKFSSQDRLNRHFKDKHPHSIKTKNMEVTEAETFDKEVKVGGKYSEDEKSTVQALGFYKHVGKFKDDENETTVEYRSEYPRRKYRQYEPPIRNEAGNLVWPCSICKMTFQKKRSQQSHVISYHTEPQHKCSLCQKTFHLASELRRHEKSCSNMQCYECCIKFSSQDRLNRHFKDKHPHSIKTKNMEVTEAETFKKKL